MTGASRAALSRLLGSRWLGSRFTHDAAWGLFFNLLSKLVGFLGTTYASRCLGPTNVGISALIQTTAQQVTLAYDGGFAIAGVRKIAQNKVEAAPAVTAITTFQLLMAVIALGLWVAAAVLFAPLEVRTAWIFGAPALVYFAGNLTFAFQGHEKLPVQNAISALGALLMAGAYFSFFRPGMALGADLKVIAGAGFVTTVIAWWSYHRLFHSWPIGRTDWRYVLSLLRESWRFWLLVVSVYFFSQFQTQLIATVLGPREAGIYRSAYVLALGLWALFSTVGSLLLPRVVAWKEAGLRVMWRKQRELFPLFLAAGVPCVLVVVLVAPALYGVFLGPAFLRGIPVFQILAVQMLIAFINQISAWGLTATGQDSQFLFASIIGAVSNVTLSLLVMHSHGIVGVAVVGLCSEVLISVSCFLFLRRYLVRQGAMAT
jgi:O-antigen/teichoic acid export membrane protein